MSRGNLLRPSGYLEDDYRPSPGELECLERFSHRASALFGLGHGADLVAVLEVDQPDAPGASAAVVKRMLRPARIDQKLISDNNTAPRTRVERFSRLIALRRYAQTAFSTVLTAVFRPPEYRGALQTLLQRGILVQALALN